MTVTVRYYASLREKRGVDKEVMTTDAPTARALFDELTSLYQFEICARSLRVSLNRSLTDLEAPIHEGDEVVFIPPVAGG